MLSKINFLMNKIYLFTAAFAVMASLSGCSDTELASIDTAQEKTPIGFHTVGSQMGSRATSINSSNLKEYSFNVYAFKNDNGTDGERFMGNDNETLTGGVKISYNGTKWDYANVKYWPTGSLNFYAVSPVPKSDDDPIFYTWQISQTTKKINYFSSDEYGTQSQPYVDVMYAIATNKSKADGTVQLQFKHITSQIVFMAKKQPIENLNVEIKSIKLHNFETNGVFTIPTNRPDLQPVQSDWKYQSHSYTCGLTVINKGDKEPKITIGTEATDISTRTPMFLIPQPLKAWDTSHDIVTADANKESYLSIECKISIDGFYNLGSESGYGTLYVPFWANWQPGKRYVYTLVFGGGYDADGHTILQPIDFDASVGDWGNDDGTTTTDKDIPLYQ